MGTPRMSAFCIDCSEDTFDDGVRFWSAAFGVEPTEPSGPEDEYVQLPGAIPGLTVEVQRIGAASRYHVDFVAADVEAEVRRFETLGAERVAQVETWWILRAPTGHLFCVVPE